MLRSQQIINVVHLAIDPKKSVRRRVRRCRRCGTTHSLTFVVYVAGVAMATATESSKAARHIALPQAGVCRSILVISLACNPSLLVYRCGLAAPAFKRRKRYQSTMFPEKGVLRFHMTQGANRQPLGRQPEGTPWRRVESTQGIRATGFDFPAGA